VQVIGPSSGLPNNLRRGCSQTIDPQALDAGTRSIVGSRAAPAGHTFRKWD
jgi:hypothetical protein